MDRFPLDTAKRIDASKTPTKKRVSKKAVRSSSNGVRKPAPPVSSRTKPGIEVKLVRGEIEGEFLEDLNRELNEGWELIEIFVKHYDFVAAVKRTPSSSANLTKEKK